MMRTTPKTNYFSTAALHVAICFTLVITAGGSSRIINQHTSRGQHGVTGDPEAPAFAPNSSPDLGRPAPQCAWNSAACNRAWLTRHPQAAHHAMPAPRGGRRGVVPYPLHGDQLEPFYLYVLRLKVRAPPGGVTSGAFSHQVDRATAPADHDAGGDWLVDATPGLPSTSRDSPGPPAAGSEPHVPGLRLRAFPDDAVGPDVPASSHEGQRRRAWFQRRFPSSDDAYLHIRSKDWKGKEKKRGDKAVAGGGSIWPAAAAAARGTRDSEDWSGPTDTRRNTGRKFHTQGW